MKIAYFDCPAGISGDMTVGALVDAGVPLEYLKDRLAALGLEGFGVSAARVSKHGIGAVKFTVDAGKPGAARSFADIEMMISKSGLEDAIKAGSLGVFEKLAAAESKIHGVPVRDVHFHEIGAVDSIVDIVAAAAGIHWLGVREVRCSPVALGSGSVKSMHGVLPVPVPATLELLKGVPVYGGGVRMELTTPTGAAILAHYSRGYGDMPAMTVHEAGYGAGNADLDVPNLLRVVIGETASDERRDRVAVLETNIDDMNPEFYEHLAERLFSAGALDVYAVPMMMKKFRPAVLLRVVAPPELREEMARLIFRESSTAGIRYHFLERMTLPRETAAVPTPYGEIRVKILRSGESVTVSPEYEDCRKAAAGTGAPLKDVYDAAKEEARRRL